MLWASERASERERDARSWPSSMYTEQTRAPQSRLADWLSHRRCWLTVMSPFIYVGECFALQPAARPSIHPERERESTPRRREERKPPANWDEPPFSHANFIARPARRQLVFTPIKIQDPKFAVKTKISSPHHYQKIGAQINPALLILNRLEKNI